MRPTRTRETVPPAPPAPESARSGGATSPRETGWLPDCVYTGEKFEGGLAFFIDGLGRIARFSREPADLAMAKRLGGQAVLPGLVNAHSHSLHRLLRGRTEHRTRSERDSLGTWRAASEFAGARVTGPDVFDTARMAFMEMLRAGITCVGEFHTVHHRPDGQPWPDPNFLAQEVLRAARDVGVRIALFKVACARGDTGPGAARGSIPAADTFLGELEALRGHVAKHHHADDAWLGVAPASVAAVPVDYLKALAAFAHAQRLRLHVPLGETSGDNEACVAVHGRRPVPLLAEHGLIDKRFTAVHAVHLADEEVRLLANARASVCACPGSERNRGSGVVAADKLQEAGIAVALGTDCQVQIDLFEEARLLEYQLRQSLGRRGVLAPEVATPLFAAATAAGARSLGAPSGALEVGRPADFFTVNLYDPSIAGADPSSLLANVVFSLDRRAIRDVWVGGRQVLANGRHAYHGAIVGRFVELQERLWGAKGTA